MSGERVFDLGDILSVVGDRLVSPRLMAGVHDILTYMAGEPIWTHQLPRVCDEARPVLLARYPQLADVDCAAFTPDNWQAWLADQKARFGSELPVPRLTADQHERIDPVSELAEKVHPDRITVMRPS